jgi:flagellar assembly protein FliH
VPVPVVPQVAAATSVPPPGMMAPLVAASTLTVTPAALPGPISVLAYEEYKQRFAAELAELREETLESAREQGLQQGQAAAEVQSRQLLNTLRDVIGSVRDAREQYVADIADEAVEIVFAAIVRILGEAFEQHDTVVAAVQEALRCSRERRRLVVRVAPRDFPVINSHRDVLFEGASASELEVVADEQVKLGGCLLEGASGDLDARLETQVQRLRETLTRVRASWDDEAQPDHG